ncbi:MAG: OsmC family protein, partial [Pseudomonadota bacterium]
RAVATVGAPATADHVQHLFAAQRDTLLQTGEAEVELGGRRFRLDRGFVEDLQSHNSLAPLAALDAALLVFHAPQDTIVSIDEAAKIYTAARHPKSFVSLDGADHLLTSQADADYVADTLAAWASRYLPTPADDDTAPALAPGEVWVGELDRTFKRAMRAGKHRLVADEPTAYGGGDTGPAPYDLLLMSLGACTSMTLRMYAERKQIPLEDVDVVLTHARVHAADCADCGDLADRADSAAKLDRLERRITLKGPLSEAQRSRLLEIADRCPVHRTLENHPVITTVLTD